MTAQFLSLKQAHNGEFVCACFLWDAAKTGSAFYAGTQLASWAAKL